MRYLGQEYTLTISIESLKNGWQLKLRNDFDRAYLIRFGHCNEEETVELVNLRVTLVIFKNKKKLLMILNIWELIHLQWDPLMFTEN